MELEVYNINGQKTDKKVKLDDSIFGIEPNDHAIYLDVKQYLANQRQGTHSSRERSDLSGSTRKIKRQKGTGTARFGDIKNPLFRGGARVFGPQPRDYWFKVNKKVKRLARKSALAYKVKENNISVIEDFSFEEPKTKNYLEFLKNFEMGDTKTLVVLPTNDSNVILSSRNLKKAKVTTPGGLNTYEILNAKHLFILEGSLKGIKEFFNSK